MLEIIKGGENHDISINPEILSNMMTELTNESDTVDKFILANIETSTKILETENKQLEARQDNLKYEQKDIVNSVLFKGLNIGIDALLDITQKYSICNVKDKHIDVDIYQFVACILNAVKNTDWWGRERTKGWVGYATSSVSEFNNLERGIEEFFNGIIDLINIDLPKLVEWIIY